MSEQTTTGSSAADKVLIIHTRECTRAWIRGL